MTVQILLATYNSEKYLAQQLDSILAQEFQEFEILIRDGGSTDSTLEIIREFCQKYPGKVTFAEAGKAGACQNFSRLLELSTAQLVMFSDHDDVWMPDKISRTLECYRKAEKKHGKETPILVFTDSKVVDEELNVLAESMFRHQHLDTRKLTFPRLTVQNVASGNSMLINRRLIEKSTPIPGKAVMHDHYLMLTACAFGKIELLNRSTLLYRQHRKNVLGAQNYGVRYFWNLLKSGREKIRSRFMQNIAQAEEFYHIHHGKLPPETEEFLAELMTFREKNFFSKRLFLLRHGMLKSGFLRNLGMFIII